MLLRQHTSIQKYTTITSKRQLINSGRWKMNTLYIIFLYLITFILFFVSFLLSPSKTFAAFKKAFKLFTIILPQFFLVTLFAGILSSIIEMKNIVSLFSIQSGMTGMFFASLAGSFTVFPVISVFPIIKEILEKGAGITQVAIFIITLTNVGFVTLPLETKFLGKKASFVRNIIAYILAFFQAFFIGQMIK